MAISANVGTTGVGAHLSVPLQSKLNARFGVGFLNYSYKSSTDDVDYKLKLKLRTFDALLDYFPMDGAFRLSASGEEWYFANIYVNLDDDDDETLLNWWVGM